jgi:molybdenum cofactor cytidylyltransferase
MTGLIILAAGASSRLGRPKQNLVFQKNTLLQRAVETALASKCRPIIVVLGANADLIETSNLSKDLTIIYNRDWSEGLASSIRVAIREIKKNDAIHNVVIMLCDQPYVSAALIDSMVIDQQATGKPIVACSYNNTIGVPALFNKSVFAELLLLKGHEGAKKILKEHPDDMVIIPFDKGSIDIDTPEDYIRLTNLSD